MESHPGDLLPAVNGITNVPKSLCDFVCERDAKHLIDVVNGEILFLKKDSQEDELHSKPVR
jgi:hypothetical protein